MKSLILILAGIVVALLIVGGVVGYTMMSEIADSPAGEESTVSKIVDKVSDVATSDDSQASDIISEVVKFNEQNGEGYYREVTYSDGGFRQYDNDSGELIGSSYDSDQDSLPSME